MKKIISFVLLLLLLLWGVSQFVWKEKETASGEKEFVLQFKNGTDIPVNMSYIEPFDRNLPEEFQSMEATVLKDTIVVNTKSGDTYIVKMLTFPDWDVKPGDIHCVEIYKDEKKIYEMKRMQAWGELPVGLRSRRKKIEYCRSLNVVDDVVVLLFSGSTLLDQLTPMSIVVLKGEEAKLVLNQSSFIVSAHFGTKTETHYGLDKTTGFAHLGLHFEKAKYDDKGKMLQRPVVKELHITEDGIWFGTDELNR